MVIVVVILNGRKAGASWALASGYMVFREWGWEFKLIGYMGEYYVIVFQVNWGQMHLYRICCL